MSTLSAGNRLPLPTDLAGNHFLYRTELPPIAPEDRDLLVQAVWAAVEETGLHTAEIDVFSVSRLVKAKGEAVRHAFGRAVSATGLDPERTTLLACEWASPHVDESFAGSAFVSVVLGTGPEPYVLQAFHSSAAAEPGQGLSLTTSTRLLNVGDAFVLDPTTPHMTAPAVPSSAQLLVLLQCEVPDETPEQRAALLHRFAPRANDRSQEGIFSGFDF